MRIRRFVLRLVVLSALGLCGSRGLFAATCVWNGTAGDWTDDTKWSGCGGTFPGATDSATISAGTVTLSSDQAVTGLTLSGGQGVTRDQMARFLGNAFNLILYAP